MSKRMDAWRWMVLVGVLCLWSGSASGFPTYYYDLDSLIYMSTEVIDGTLGPNADTVTVTRVHKGKFEVGDTVELEAMHGLRKGQFGKSEEIGEGDVVTLFLVRATKRFLYDIPEDAEIYWPVPSGVKLHADGKVAGLSSGVIPVRCTRLRGTGWRVSRRPRRSMRTSSPSGSNTWTP